MTLPDFQDWATAVDGVEHVSAALVPGNVITAGADPALIDTSRYRSLALLLKIPGGADNKRIALNAEWQNSGQPVDYDLVTLNNANVLQPYPDWHQLHLPVRGSACQLRYYDEVGGRQIQLFAFGSTREADLARGRIARLNWGQNLMDINTGAVVPAAASATLYVPPVARAFGFQVAANVNTTPYLVTISGISAIGSALSVARVYVADFTTRANIVEVPLSGVGLEVTITNNDAANRNFNVRFWDAS